MNSKFLALLCMAALEAGSVYAAKVNTEKTITVNGVKRKYILYVPNKLEDKPALVVSLHGASGHDTDYSPFKTNIADAKGCIVVYPQGRDQYFPIFGGSVDGMPTASITRTWSFSRASSTRLRLLILLTSPACSAADSQTAV